ncbi:MAG: putative endonuclease [Flavobacterium sp.]|jgi:putative endonuclease
MEYFVYILCSKLKSKFYIGYTSNLEERITRHNQKSKGFTGSVNDWEVIYTETFNKKELAIQRERVIKSWKSSVKIKELIGRNM